MRNVHTFHSNPLLRIHFSFRKCWFSSKMHHRKSWFKTKSSQEKSCFRFAWNMFDRHSLFKIKLLQLKTLLQIKSFAFYLASNPKNACRKYTLLRIHFFFFWESLASRPIWLNKTFLLIQSARTKCLAFAPKYLKKGLLLKLCFPKMSEEKSCKRFEIKSSTKGFAPLPKFRKQSLDSKPKVLKKSLA